MNLKNIASDAGCSLNDFKVSFCMVIKFLKCIVILNLVFLLSCNGTQPLDDERPENLISNNTESFPIKVGNYWHYSSLERDVEIEWRIVSDSTINGNLYYLYQISHNKNISDTILIGKNNNGDIIKRIGGKDYIWFKLSSIDSSDYTFPFESLDNTEYIVSVSDKFQRTLSDNSKVTCIAFSFDVSSIIDEEIIYSFSTGYGIVGIGSCWFSLGLTQAKLN